MADRRVYAKVTEFQKLRSITDGRTRTKEHEYYFHEEKDRGFPSLVDWNFPCCRDFPSLEDWVFPSKRKMLKFAPQVSPRNETRVIRLTADQEAVLREHFNRWPKAPHTADVVLLAAETGLSEEDVQGWYEIRLAQWRKEQGLGGNLGLH